MEQLAHLCGRQGVEEMVDVAEVSSKGERAGRNRNKPASSAALHFCLIALNVSIFQSSMLK